MQQLWQYVMDMVWGHLPHCLNPLTEDIVGKMTLMRSNSYILVGEGARKILVPNKNKKDPRNVMPKRGQTQVVRR